MTIFQSWQCLALFSSYVDVCALAHHTVHYPFLYDYSLARVGFHYLSTDTLYILLSSSQTVFERVIRGWYRAELRLVRARMQEIPQ